MILEIIVTFLCSILETVLIPLQAITLPFNLISTLATITGFGSYIVGADLLIIFSGCILFWSGIKIVVSFALFVWDLLPLT